MMNQNIQILLRYVSEHIVSYILTNSSKCIFIFLYTDQLQSSKVIEDEDHRMEVRKVDITDYS